MRGWRPITEAPRDIGRPLLLYPRPRAAYNRDRPLLDLRDVSVRRMMKLGRKRGFITCEELGTVVPLGEFSADEVATVIGLVSEMGIAVEGTETVRCRAGGRPESLETYVSVFEGAWDGAVRRTPDGKLCAPTHWRPMPTPPLTLVLPG